MAHRAGADWAPDASTRVCQTLSPSRSAGTPWEHWPRMTKYGEPRPCSTETGMLRGRDSKRNPGVPMVGPTPPGPTQPGRGGVETQFRPGFLPGRDPPAARSTDRSRPLVCPGRRWRQRVLRPPPRAPLARAAPAEPLCWAGWRGSGRGGGPHGPPRARALCRGCLHT